MADSRCQTFPFVSYHVNASIRLHHVCCVTAYPRLRLPIRRKDSSVHFSVSPHSYGLALILESEIDISRAFFACPSAVRLSSRSSTGKEGLVHTRDTFLTLRDSFASPVQCACPCSSHVTLANTPPVCSCNTSYFRHRPGFPSLISTHTTLFDTLDGAVHPRARSHFMGARWIVVHSCAAGRSPFVGATFVLACPLFFREDGTC